MSDNTTSKPLTDVEKVRDLFGMAHDMIAQSTYPGHLSPKVVEVMQFLAYQYGDFKMRAEAFAKAELSKVNVVAAKLATDAVLVETAVETVVEKAVEHIIPGPEAQ